MQPTIPSERYRPITRQSFSKSSSWQRLPGDLRHDVEVVSAVLPFRTNDYVVHELIDWDRVPDDPIFQLTFPQREMLAGDEYRRVERLLERRATRDEMRPAINTIRLSLNPHPDGQRTHNVPTLDGRPLPGLQHKYSETVLFFPSSGQTCHAYCTYCFRWAQFVDLPEMRFSARETLDLVAYLKVHPEVSDVLITGGDPLVMRTRILRRYVEPLLRIPHVRHLRFATKAVAYWPQRFVSDDDADDLLRLFEEVVESGRHPALMAHYSHPVELSTGIAREAVRRIRDAGAEVRMQGPLVRHVNDRAEAWSELWLRGVGLGCIPYYLFVERDTGPRDYFEVPLVRAHEIFRDAYSRVSGLARTVRGPSMSALPGKVRVLGVAEAAGERVLVLDFLQARNPDWVRRPFFARYDPEAAWLDELRPAFGEPRFFFEDGCGHPPWRVGADRLAAAFATT